MPRTQDITYFACTNGRLPHRTFGIRQADRFSHLYLIGRTGTGKSTLIVNLSKGRLGEDSAHLLLTLANHDIYLKLMIDGAPSRPFSATTLHPLVLDVGIPPSA